TLLAVDAGVDRLHRLALGVEVHRLLALGEGAAREERAALALAAHHRRAALGALVLRRLDDRHRLAVGADVHDRLALRAAGAAEERPNLAEPLGHRLAAGRALDLALDLELGRLRLALRRLEVVAAAVLLAPARAADEFLPGLAGVVDDQRLAALGAVLARLLT